MNFQFKKEKAFNDRKSEHDKIMEDHPNKIAIICEKVPESKIKNIDKTKYLVDGNLTIPQFAATIRKKLEMGNIEALFFLVNGKITLNGNMTINEVYKKYKDKDGFLYIAYAAEEIWGCRF